MGRAPELVPKHFLKLATSASQPPSHQRISSVFSNFLEPQSSMFKFQIPNCIPTLSHSLISLIRLISYDPSRSEAIPPIRPDTSEPCDLLHTHTHTHCQYLSFLSPRMLVIVRTSSTRGARLGTRAGTCTAENEPCEVRKFELSEMLNLNFEISKLLFATQVAFVYLSAP